MNTPERLEQLAEDKAERTEVEGVFGMSKRIYNADNIRAKLPDTGESWTAACFFAKNVAKFMRAVAPATL